MLPLPAGTPAACGALRFLKGLGLEAHLAFGDP